MAVLDRGWGLVDHQWRLKPLSFIAVRREVGHQLGKHHPIPSRVVCQSDKVKLCSKERVELYVLKPLCDDLLI